VNLDSLCAVGRIYIIARRIVLGIVFLAAAGLGVTVYNLQHQPVQYDTDSFQNHRYDAKYIPVVLDGLRSGSQIRGWERAA
jgi:hypothetical protein